MENTAEFLIMAFAVIVLVFALSITLYLLSNAMQTTDKLIYHSDKTNYLQNIEFDETANLTTRIVNRDTVITSLYRYYKENFMVRIRDSGGDVIQLFDTTIEGQVYAAASLTATELANRPRESALMAAYGDIANPNNPKNMFGAPWMGNVAKDAKYRVDLYVMGDSGYINNQNVNYALGNGFPADANTFRETFVEYMYSGQTIQTPDGIETLTGNAKEKDKIIIDYQVIP